MPVIQGVPYAPGQAHGALRRLPAGSGDILLLPAREISALVTRPAGIIVVDAAPFSHAMIRLIALSVPIVMLDGAQAASLAAGEIARLDGTSGRLLLGESAAAPVAAEPPAPPPGQALYTADGVAVELRASVRDAPGAAAALARGAHSIGLVRSEYLAPRDGSRPDAAFFERAIGELCEAAKPLPVTLRLLDVAPDKRPSWLADIPGMAGPLGLQGARLYDIEPVKGVLDAQIEAVARLAGRYPLRLLVPYLVRHEELARRRARIESRLPGRPLFGAMLETPAAALEIAEFCEVADFVALGTNDLMQCLFAADRDLPELRDYLSAYAPALYRFLRMVADNAGPHLHRVQMCGVLSQWPGVLPVLLGLGFRNLSVDPVTVPYLAQIVAATRVSTAAALADAVCAAQRSSEVSTMLEVPAWSASAQRGDSDG